jgi:long-chain acyl-CoA synthetase
VQATPEEFTEWARTRMAGYKRPREIEFRDSLPVTQVGKVLRRVLREEEVRKKSKESATST